MSGETPERIDFRGYSQTVSENIPIAVQQATRRFLNNRSERVLEMPEWEKLRQSASDLRLHTLQFMDLYLEKAAEKVANVGGIVHWAIDAEEARQIILKIAQDHQVKTAVKVKSMATEEIALNQALENAGIQAYETDLGEFIIQLAGSGPSHIIAPAVHLKKEEIASLFQKKLQIDAEADPQVLTSIAREILRENF